MKKICLVCDIPNWAFDNIAKKVKDNLKGTYDITIDYYDMRANPDEFYELLEKYNSYDLIHFFWRKTLILMESEVLKNKVEASGRRLDDYIAEKSKKISTGCYDFMFLDDDGIEIYKNIFNKYAGHYYVTSKRLYSTYKKIEEIKKPTAIVHDLFESKGLKPINIERLDNRDKELVVGWVGNGAFRFNTIDLKGLNTIIKPIIQELQEEGYNIRGHYADRNEKWRTAEEMPKYYSEIDVCLCTSIHEGTPLPILEAMSCGVPVISTDVGVVSEALGKRQKEYILGDRENGVNDENIKKTLKEKLIQLYNNREILKELSEENLKSIVEYDGGKILKEFEEYFVICLKYM